MSILIKGMEMPKSCRDCFVNINTAAFPACPLAENYAAGKALVADGLGHDIRPDDCPLIEIPPHGDLIDRDALMNMCREMQSIEWNNKASPYSWAYAYESFEDDIDNAPTIIPAEEGE